MRLLLRLRSASAVARQTTAGTDESLPPGRPRVTDGGEACCGATCRNPPPSLCFLSRFTRTLAASRCPLLKDARTPFPDTVVWS